MRVPKADQRGSLADEPGHRLRVGGERLMQDLDRVAGPGRLILAAPDGAHPAAADLLMEKVPAPQRPFAHGWDHIGAKFRCENGRVIP